MPFMILLPLLGLLADPSDDEADVPGISRKAIPGLLGDPPLWGWRGGVGEEEGEGSLEPGWTVKDGSLLLNCSLSFCFFFQILFSWHSNADVDVNISSGLSDLDNDDDVHDEDAYARDDLGQDALEDHHNHPHGVVTDAALLRIAPAVLIAQLIMALTWLQGDFLLDAIMYLLKFMKLSKI